MAGLDTEKDVKRAVKRLLTRHGWFWWMPAANGFGQVGVADFCALKAGVFLALETKKAPRKPTAQQVKFLRRVTDEGAFGIVVSDRTLTHLEAWLVAFDVSVSHVSKRETPPAEAGAELIDCLAVLTAPVREAP